MIQIKRDLRCDADVCREVNRILTDALVVRAVRWMERWIQEQAMRRGRVGFIGWMRAEQVTHFAKRQSDERRAA